jgi:hypothetical protein
MWGYLLGVPSGLRQYQQSDSIKMSASELNVDEIHERSIVFCILIGLLCIQFYFLYLYSCRIVDQDRKIRIQAQGHEDVREALRTERLSKWNSRISKLATLRNEESILEQIIALLRPAIVISATAWLLPFLPGLADQVMAGTLGRNMGRQPIAQIGAR